jgi:hypothetical protein
LEEREKWIRALEDTVLRHNQMRRVGGPPKSTRAKWSSGCEEPPTMEDFDKKLAETDSYLQLLLNQVSGLKSKIDLNNTNATLPTDSLDNNGDVYASGDNGEHAKKMRKSRYEDIANKAVGMTESIKHAIVLLQIAKNASSPQTDHEIKTFKSGQSPDLLNKIGTSDERNYQSHSAASSVDRTDINNHGVLTEHLATTGLPREKLNDGEKSDIHIGDKLSESSATRNVVIKPEQDSPLSSIPQYSSQRKTSLKLVQQTIPDESYESDSDDEFYEANDFVDEFDGGKHPGSSSLSNSIDAVRPELLEFSTDCSKMQFDESYSCADIMSPMTPEMDENDENIDYDKLYENEDDEGDLDMKSHGSVITHLLSQVRIGMDLTKIVLPTFILERRSLLEMYSDFFAHPDLFLDIPDGNSPEERMIRALKWYLSSFHAGRKSSIAKKPYNPILGETFRCHWKVPSEKGNSSHPAVTVDSIRCPKEVAKESALPECGPDELTFIAEQVSHHPPISAFYAEHVDKRISTCAHIYTKSSFLGMSVS